MAVDLSALVYGPDLQLGEGEVLSFVRLVDPPTGDIKGA